MQISQFGTIWEPPATSGHRGDNLSLRSTVPGLGRYVLATSLKTFTKIQTFKKIFISLLRVNISPYIFPINSPYFPHIHILFFSHFCRLLKFSVSSDFLWSEKGCGQLGTAQKTWLGVETVRSKRLVRKYSKYSTMIFIDFCKNHMDHMDISEVTRYRQFWWLVIIFFLQTPFFGSPILRTPHNISRNWWYRNSTTLRHSGFWTQPGALRHCWDFFLGW